MRARYDTPRRRRDHRVRCGSGMTHPGGGATTGSDAAAVWDTQGELDHRVRCGRGMTHPRGGSSTGSAWFPFLLKSSPIAGLWVFSRQVAACGDRRWLDSGCAACVGMSRVGRTMWMQLHRGEVCVEWPSMPSRPSRSATPWQAAPTRDPVRV